MALTERFPNSRMVVHRKRKTVRISPDRPQQRRHSFRNLLQAGILQSAVLPRRERSRWLLSAGEHGIPYDICGKVIVATDDSEIPALERLAHAERLRTGSPVQRLTPEQLREREPHVASVASHLLPTTGITSYPPGQPRRMPGWSPNAAATLRLDTPRDRHPSDGGEQVIETTQGADRDEVPDQLRRSAQRPHRAHGGRSTPACESCRSAASTSN